MKILWLSWKDITHPDAGGAEISGVEHAKAWVKAGHTVHWVSTGFNNSKANDSHDGVSYEHLGKKWMWFLGIIHILFAYNWLIKWNKEYDLVIDEIHGPPLLTPLYVRKPIFVIIHEVAGDIWKKTIPFPLSWIAQYVVEPIFFKAYKNTQMIVGAETTKEDLLAIGIPEKNIKFISYGVTISNSSATFPKEAQPTLLFLSSIRPMKGLDRVYDAYKSIKMRMPECVLWIAGDYSLPYAEELKSKIIADDPTIKFFGRIPQEKKFELLQRAHLLVHGSYKEGWGLVVIEANSVGTPAVVFDAAGLRNSVDDSKTGNVAKNKEEFIEDVLVLLKDSRKYEYFQQNAREWSKNFTWEKSTTESTRLISQYSTDPS